MRNDVNGERQVRVEQVSLEQFMEVQTQQGSYSMSHTTACGIGSCPRLFFSSTNERMRVLHSASLRSYLISQFLAYRISDVHMVCAPHTCDFPCRSNQCTYED